MSEWKATIESVLDNHAVPDDTVTVNVRFCNGESEYRQVMTFRAGTTKETVLAEIRRRAADLTAFEPVKADLRAMIGQEIEGR
jgi:hypothetical protein